MWPLYKKTKTKDHILFAILYNKTVCNVADPFDRDMAKSYKARMHERIIWPEVSCNKPSFPQIKISLAISSHYQCLVFCSRRTRRGHLWYLFLEQSTLSAFLFHLSELGSLLATSKSVKRHNLCPIFQSCFRRIKQEEYVTMKQVLIFMVQP